MSARHPVVAAVVAGVCRRPRRVVVVEQEQEQEQVQVQVQERVRVLVLVLVLVPVPVPVPVPVLARVPVLEQPRCSNADTSYPQFPRLRRHETGNTYRRPQKWGRPE